MAAYVQQHYVPKFLLEQWHSGSDDRLTVFKVEHGRLLHDRHKAKRVASQEHLYSHHRPNGEKDVTPERDFFGPHVDEPAATVHAAVLAGRMPDLDDRQREDWARFLSMQQLRVPDAVDSVGEYAAAALLTALDTDPDGYRNKWPGAPDATLRERFEQQEAQTLEDFGRRALPAIAQTETLMRRFLDHVVWSVRRLERAPFDLLVGDNPLILETDASGGRLYALPIAPRCLFLVVNNDRLLHQVDKAPPGKVVRRFNLETVRRARRYVYATSDEQQRFVENHLHEAHA